MSVNISINTNTVAVQENINHISVNDPNNPNIVDITQPVTNVVEIITAGPQGPPGPSGSGGGGGSLTGGTNNYIPLWSGSTALTSSIARQTSGYLQISGSVNITGSLSQGSRSIALGDYSHAEGTNTTASGDYSHAEGWNTIALSDGSHAEGAGTVASGDYSHAEGQSTRASGLYSHAEGLYATSSGNYSHAEGGSSQALGDFSHAEGVSTQAKGYGSHTEGYFTVASGSASHAEGWLTQAIGHSSHAEGSGSIALGTGSHAEGLSASSSGNYSHAEGYFTTTTTNFAHAEGAYTTASGEGSHAEGQNTIALGPSSHAEGYGATSTGPYAHAEGSATRAAGFSSHAEGYFTTAQGDYSHAEGEETLTLGQSSHTEGRYTTSSGDWSHAEGANTIASGSYSHAEGYYTNSSGSYSHAEGIGFDTTSTDIIYINTLASITTDYFNEVVISATTDQLILEGDASQATPLSLNYIELNNGNLVFPVNSAFYTNIPVVTSIVYDAGRNESTLTLNPPFQSSYNNIVGNGVIAEGYGSHAEGFSTKSTGNYSHAEGYSTIASGHYQHVQGQYNLSSSAQSAFIVGNGTADNARSNLVFASGSQFQITGSLQVTGGITGSVFGTSSNSLTASYVNPLNQTVQITGSLNISGSETLTGYMQFMPVTTNINNSISASYIYVSGSTNDLYFTQNGQGYGNTTRLRWIEGNLYTGLLSGGVISSTLGSTTFNVSSGSGIIVTLNAFTSSQDPYPTVQYVKWPTYTSLPIENSGSAKITYLSINSSGTVAQQTVPIGSTDVTQWDTQIELGVVLHLSGSVSTGVYNSPQVGYGFAQRTDDFVRAFGPMKMSGHTLQASGSSPTLSLIKGAGTAYNNGANYVNNPNHPSTVSDPAVNTSKIYRYYISGSTPIIDTGVANAGYSAIDSKYYVDTTTGTLALVGGAYWSIQRVFWIPNSPTNAFIVYYGNDRYRSLVDATNAKDSEPFIEAPNTAQNAIFLGYIIIQGGGSGTPPRDLLNASEATILQGGLFRNVGGIGSSGTSPIATTFASLSDVSVASRTNGDLPIYNGSQWANGKVLTGNYSINGGLTVTGSIIGTASLATTASYAVTASYALNGGGGSSGPSLGLVQAFSLGLQNIF
jgi:hypothetical protein